MKRWARPILSIVLFLLLGAVVNIAVACGINVLQHRLPTKNLGWHPPNPRDIEWWQANAPHGFPAVPTLVYERECGFGRKSSIFYDCWENTDLVRGDVVGRNRYGWPCFSVEGAVWMNKSGTNTFQFMHRVPQPFPGEGHWLSVKPLWPGFAINTVFYALILWLLFAALFAIRKRRRIKRGLCPKCAYPVGTNARCTECGTAVSPALEGGGKGGG